MTEILLKVALNTISLSTTYIHVSLGYIARFTVNNHKLICLNLTNGWYGWGGVGNMHLSTIQNRIINHY